MASTYRWTNDRSDDRHSRLWRRARARMSRWLRATGAAHAAETPFTVDLGGGGATVGAIDQLHARARRSPRARAAARTSPCASARSGTAPPMAIPASSASRSTGYAIEPLTASWWAGARGGWPWALRMLAARGRHCPRRPIGLERRGGGRRCRAASRSAHSRCRRRASSRCPCSSRRRAPSRQLARPLAGRGVIRSRARRPAAAGRAPARPLAYASMTRASFARS